MRSRLSRPNQACIHFSNLPNVRDAALIIAGQRVEHFEIAGYGSAKTIARVLGHGDFADALEQIEEEEVTTDQTLTGLAERLNAEALAETT